MSMEGHEIVMDASQKQIEESGEDARSVVERTGSLFNEEQLRDIILDYREKWLEEDDERMQQVCQEISQETCYAIFDEQITGQVNVKQEEQDEAIKQLAQSVEVLNRQGQEMDQRSAANAEKLYEMVRREQKAVQIKLKSKRDDMDLIFSEMKEDMRIT